MPEPQKKIPAHRIRPVNRDTRFAKLKACKCFSEVHQRIIDGWQISEVARFVQDDCQEYSDVSRASLISVLKEYRATIPPAQLVKKRMPQVFAKAAEEVQKGLDELHELEKLYKIQMKRVGIDVDTEEKIKKLMPSMTQEIRTAREILHTYAQLKMDLGLTDRHLGTVGVDAQITGELVGRYGSESVSQVAANPESRRKVLGLAEKLLQIAARRRDETEPGAEQEVEESAITEEPLDPEDGLEDEILGDESLPEGSIDIVDGEEDSESPE